MKENNMGFFGWIMLIAGTLGAAWIVDWIIDHFGGGKDKEHTIKDFNDEVKKI